MSDEITTLRSQLAQATQERDEARNHVEKLQAKIYPDKTCACSVDRPGDVCLHHSPMLEKAIKERDEARAERDKYRRRKDEAYEERNRVVAALAHVFPSGIKRTDIPDWDPEWHGCVYIDTPEGQLSWHYHDSQADLFCDLPPYGGEWDGHDTRKKYRRLERLCQREGIV